ncbi:MAG TPA: DUF4261 domain-containing protein [Tepidisphaeraceae bacterium]|nr:DUF4261 domain-containing protein [Tepidisphaeraceae bacterium]
MSKSTDELPGIYAAELLCSAPPRLDRASLLAAIRSRLPDTQPLDDNPQSNLLAFVHPKHAVTYKEGALPAQSFVHVSDQPPKAEFFAESIQQSWAFKDAAASASKCRATVFVSDMMASGLDYRDRLALFQNTLLAVLWLVPCDGVHLHASRQIVHPKWITDALAQDPPPSFAAGVVNIRMFNISNAGPGEKVMDSLGLSALGLCDVQCHFRNLDPSAVARVLYNTAAYLFERGDVIGDGHTIGGIHPGSKWRCQHEDSLVPPTRVVLDLNPGAPFAAGGRT